MNEYAEKLINILIDKYEKSSAFKNREIPKRRILIKLYDNGKCEFPLYDIEQDEKRKEINQIVCDLCKDELILFNWMKGEENHIISEVWLNYKNISAVYTYLGRKPKNDEIDDICISVLEALENIEAQWAKCFLQDAYNYIFTKRKLGSFLPAAPKERDGLIHCICFASKLKNAELSERVFSMRCFGNSKEFEQKYRSRLVGILKKYMDTEQNNDDEELLRQVGIVKYPEQFEFCGGLTLKKNNVNIDFSNLNYGTAIFADELDNNIIISDKIDRIITIENRANYIDYIYKQKKENELVIYHGGQYSKSKKSFFELVSKSMGQNCIWLHWGDIDYGGFSMLSRLRKEINANIKPYLMGVSQLERYEKYCADFNDEYAKKLKQLVSYEELADCVLCIEYMLKRNKRLEQEAFL